MDSLLLGCALGLFAGIVPGPFLTLVATTALERGLGDGLKVALIPLVTETPVLIASIFLLSQLPHEALRWIGMAGGVLVLYIAWKVERDARSAHPERGDMKPFRGHFLRVALVGLLAPAPWIFWFLIAGPLFLIRWHVSPWHGVVFVLAFFSCFVGAMMTVAWGASRGREKLSLDWYRRTLRGAGVLLAIGGCILIWQSWEGNFAEMVRPQRQIRDAVEEVSAGPGPSGGPGSGARLSPIDRPARRGP